MMYAFSQILNKPFLQGDELLQLNDAGLPASKIIREKFGSADGEDLKKANVTSAMAVAALLEAMEKMPKVSGGFQNALDNLSDSVTLATAQFGMTMNEKFLPTITKIGDEISKLTEAGYFTELGESIAGITATFEGRDVPGDIRAVADAIKFLADTAESTANVGREGYNIIEKIQDVFKDIPGTPGWMRAQARAQEEGTNFEKAQSENFESWKAKGIDVDKILKERADREQSRKDKAAEDAKPASAASQQIEYLKQIATNTKAMPEVMKTILGGGELGKFGVSATELKGMGHAKKAVKHLEIMGFGSGMSGSRKLARPGF
jgi:hypothetical protein